MTSRERILKSLSFQVSDRVPRDLGGMRSTGISAFCYPKLVAALGLPPRRPRVEDAGQMLALPDLDVLDALGCDVVTICDGATNAIDQPGLWRDYDFNGRLPARVRNPCDFRLEPDGTILQGESRMVPSSFVFDAPHGGQPLLLDGDLPKPDIKKVRKDLADCGLRDEKIRSIRDLCRRVRGSTDRAVFFNDGAVNAPISIHAWGGIAVFPVLCLTEPDFVAELHEMLSGWVIGNINALLPEIREYVDIIMIAADDWGTQRNLIAPPRIYRDLFLPYRRRVNDACHALAPDIKVFLHSCGAIHDLIDLLVESRFDVLNPVQWPAGDHSYREWKEKARNRIAFWGGGINSQGTLIHGTLADVQNEAHEIAQYMSRDGGYVFCGIHNLLAEVLPEKIIAMYNAV